MRSQVQSGLASYTKPIGVLFCAVLSFVPTLALIGDMRYFTVRWVSVGRLVWKKIKRGAKINIQKKISGRIFFFNYRKGPKTFFREEKRSENFFQKKSQNPAYDRGN